MQTNPQKPQANYYSVNSLRRWSCSEKDELPKLEKIRDLHVYDFDNTLFSSPLPNRQIWDGSQIGRLQNPDVFCNGGWWHDPSVLSMTGEGIEKEEPRAWNGWWNEHIVDLVKLSMEQNDAISVLLTGRAEDKFADLIQRIVKSKGLTFDMICLKPAIGPRGQTFSSTMQCKQGFLEELIKTYSQAERMRIYEDRPKHVDQFRIYLGELNKRIEFDAELVANGPRDPLIPIRQKAIDFEVVEVNSAATTLDPVAETAQVLRMINSHNAALKSPTTPSNSRLRPLSLNRNVFYTAYLIDPPDTKRLLSSAGLPISTEDSKLDPNTRTLANCIMITPRPAPQMILDRCGELGRKLRWRVTGFGQLENRLFAARVEPVPADARCYTDSKTPHVVLARRDNVRPQDALRIQSWTPVDPKSQIEFETAVGEKVLLRVEEERTMAPPPPSQAAANPASNSALPNPPKPLLNPPVFQDFPPLPAPTHPQPPPQPQPQPQQPLPSMQFIPNPQSAPFKPPFQTPTKPPNENKRTPGSGPGNNNNKTPRGGINNSGSRRNGPGRSGGGGSSGRGGNQNNGNRGGMGGGNQRFGNAGPMQSRRNQGQNRGGGRGNKGTGQGQGRGGGAGGSARKDRGGNGAGAGFGMDGAPPFMGPAGNVGGGLSY